MRNRTNSNAALLPYLTHQLGLAHEWNCVWNGPIRKIPFVVYRVCGGLILYSTFTVQEESDILLSKWSACTLMEEGSLVYHW